MKKVLITGGTGYIGGILTQYLLDNGYEVTITSRKLLGKSNIAEVRLMDLLDETSIVGVCHGMDAVIHTATYDLNIKESNSRDMLLANGYATKALLEDAVREKVGRFIYLSTFHVYGKGSGFIDELVKAAPLSDYALTHYVAELYCHQCANMSPLKPVIARITNGYGLPISKNSSSWDLVANQFCKMAKQHKQIRIVSDKRQYRDFIALKDIAPAIERLLNYENSQEQEEVFNISSEKALSLKQLAELVAKVYKERYCDDAEIICNSHLSESEANIDKYLKVSSSKLRALGWKPSISMEQEINELFSKLDIDW